MMPLEVFGACGALRVKIEMTKPTSAHWLIELAQSLSLRAKIRKGMSISIAKTTHQYLLPCTDYLALNTKNYEAHRKASKENTLLRDKNYDMDIQTIQEEI